MTKEQEKAIKVLEKYKKECLDVYKVEIDDTDNIDEPQAFYLRQQIEAVNTVLNILKEKNKKINSKNGAIKALQCALKERTEERDRKDDIISNQNKIIDLMAEYIFQNVDVEEDICNSAYVECIQETAQDITCINCIKQYFKQKATNNG